LCKNSWRLGSLGEFLIGGRACVAVNDVRVWTSQCTFRDVLFRIDARLELPRGTLLRHEHKSTVKGRIKDLLVSFVSSRSPIANSRPLGPKNSKLTSSISISSKQNKRTSRHPLLRRNEPPDMKRVRNPISEGKQIPKQVTKRILITRMNPRRRRSRARRQSLRRRKAKLLKSPRAKRRSQVLSRKLRKRHPNPLCVCPQVIFVPRALILLAGFHLGIRRLRP